MLESTLVELYCPRTGATCDADRPQTLSEVGGPLYARYDLDAASGAWREGAGLAGRPHGVWRYADILPVRDERFRLTLGEGGTPLLPAPRLGARVGLANLLLKDEGLNPTGSFKARGLCMAVSRAVELGIEALAIPTAGNAGGALSAYAARAGVPATVYMPADAPGEFVDECEGLGATVIRVDGLITDAGARLAADAADKGFFSVATLKEPYRVEGKKTMGIELAEQMGWTLPDAILYPTGGGTGLVGMWKAFDELEELGCIGAERPRMIAVQSTGCAPVVRAFDNGDTSVTLWENAATVADGLRVPMMVGDQEILRALRESGGTAIAVPDEESMVFVRRLGADEGLYASPEDGAVLAAIPRLIQRGDLDADETVAAFMTGSGYKYRSGMKRYLAAREG
ncbi:MAG: threonine synthase [Acidobacteriota bacterium]|jgi:threonine synthase